MNRIYRIQNGARKANIHRHPVHAVNPVNPVNPVKIRFLFTVAVRRTRPQKIGNICPRANRGRKISRPSPFATWSFGLPARHPVRRSFNEGGSSQSEGGNVCRNGSGFVRVPQLQFAIRDSRGNIPIVSPDPLIVSPDPLMTPSPSRSESSRRSKGGTRMSHGENPLKSLFKPPAIRAHGRHHGGRLAGVSCYLPSPPSRSVRRVW